MRSGAYCVFIVLLCLASAMGWSDEQRETNPHTVIREDTVNIATDKQRPTNHLQHETSPYLLQHAHNPVDWYPWGEEALHKAKQEDKPIFLSIGYSACHWCHVMAHESFENEAIAALLKEHFVSIKVDREERPDLDDIYMTAVVAIAGRGGWPMSVFLTPDQKPFYGGTYYPPEDRYGMPGFPTVLKSLTQAWQEKRADIEKSADSLTQYLDANLAAEEKTVGSLSPDLIRNAVAQLHQQFDGANGGWGSAPKFPSSGSIALLLREYYRTQDEKALHMATVTLDKMACGGMYDHVGGGFHRYAVDAEWRVPHFEKMLYDNAQLSRVYLEAYQLTGKDFYRHIAEETFDYILRDMTNAQGGFYSAEDADSEGEEGKFYLWTYGELGKILGEDTSEAFMAHYTIRPEGNFSSPEAYHDGFNIPHIADAVPDEDHYFTESRARLRAVREQRIRPNKDDKVLTSWNALMISSLTRGSRILDKPHYLEAALKAGNFIRTTMMSESRLHRSWRDGKTHLDGYLDDYAFTLNAFIDLYEATFDTGWIDAARQLADHMTAQFWDNEEGGFFMTSNEATALIVRPKPGYDTQEPSGNSMAALGLLRLAVLCEVQDYRAKAEKTLIAHANRINLAPMGYLVMLKAVDFLVHSPKEIVLAGPLDDTALQALLHTARRQFLPNRVIAWGNPDDGSYADTARKIPLLANKAPVDGKATAYVCVNYTCQRPVHDANALQAQLRGQ